MGFFLRRELTENIIDRIYFLYVERNILWEA